MRAPARLLLLGMLLIAGCARTIDVGSEPRPTFSIAVQNALAEPMIVSYTDERGQALLGTVQPGRTEYYVIAGTTSTHITVSGRNENGTVTTGPWTVRLAAGERPTVRLR
jgi:hypothetical protein